jgi:brefeldin A-inhibited guanine nucleotide-exchange protein 3
VASGAVSTNFGLQSAGAIRLYLQFDKECCTHQFANRFVINFNLILALIDLLQIDLDGLNNNHQGGQMLTDICKLRRTASITETTLEVEAGMKLSRRILTCCWNSMLTVLTNTIGEGSSESSSTTSLQLLLGTEKARSKHKHVREAVIASHEGLQIAARLSNILGWLNGKFL